MKFNTVALSLATAGLVAAQPHHHAHRHHHKREIQVEGSTVFEFKLGDEVLTNEEACAGLAKGIYKWAAGVDGIGACPSSSSVAPTSTATPTPTSSASPIITPAAAEFFEASSSSSSSSSTTPPPSSTSSATPSPSSVSSAASSSASSSAAGIDVDFPDGEIDCSDFPSAYGPVALDYLGLGGYSGIQYVSGNLLEDIITTIVTAVTGDSCTDGAMCSYACPAGYQKSQWPKAQGSTGQSVGGLECKSGKLYLTNTDLSKKLCIEGVGGVHVQNNVGEQVAVCRTDYPGTESETVPLALGLNDLQPLTCPNGATYYKWENKTTSAQYYVNPKGVSTEKGCQWGDGSESIGNYAPINLGVGENDGKWLSIFQNSPTTTEKLDFSIEIKGDDMSGSCKYDHTTGEFTSETGSNDSGCTVEVLSGDATFVFSS